MEHIYQQLRRNEDVCGNVEERCKGAFHQYLRCIYLNKKPERCEYEFYEKCSSKWNDLDDEKTRLNTCEHTSSKSKD